LKLQKRRGEVGRLELPAAAATTTTTTTAAAAATTATASAAAAAATPTATTAATATTTAAAAAIFAGTSFVDSKVTTVEILAVHARDGRLGLRVVGHFDEAEATGAPGVAIHNEGRRSDFAESLESGAESGLRRAEREIAYVKLH